MTQGGPALPLPRQGRARPGADRALHGALPRRAGRHRRAHPRRAREARRLRRPLRRRPARPAHVPVRHARRRVPDAARPDARRGDRLHRRQRGVGREGPRRRPARGHHRRGRPSGRRARASSSAASRERCSSRARTATSRASTPPPRGCWRASARHRRRDRDPPAGGPRASSGCRGARTYPRGRTRPRTSPGCARPAASRPRSPCDLRGTSTNTMAAWRSSNRPVAGHSRKLVVTSPVACANRPRPAVIR